ncbi:MAG: hypothetical protein AB1592_14870 [Pseudomonadota bacterium]
MSTAQEALKGTLRRLAERPTPRAMAPVRCFVDAPILLYLQDRSEARKRAMARHSLRSIRRNGELVVSPQVLGELYGDARRRFPLLPRDTLRAYLGDLMPACRSAGPLELMDRAFRVEDRLHLPWAHCLLIASAQAAECRILVSEDLEDGLSHERTLVVNPFLTDIEPLFTTFKER